MRKVYIILSIFLSFAWFSCTVEEIKWAGLVNSLARLALHTHLLSSYCSWWNSELLTRMLALTLTLMYIYISTLTLPILNKNKITVNHNYGSYNAVLVFAGS